MACYIPRWYTRPKTVTHPGTNRARRALTSFIQSIQWAAYATATQLKQTNNQCVQYTAWRKTGATNLREPKRRHNYTVSQSVLLPWEGHFGTETNQPHRFGSVQFRSAAVYYNNLFATRSQTRIQTKLYAPQNLTLDCSPPGYPPSRLLTVVN